MDLNDFVCRARARAQGVRIFGPEGGLGAFPIPDYSEEGKREWMERNHTCFADEVQEERVVEVVQEPVPESELPHLARKNRETEETGTKRDS